MNTFNHSIIYIVIILLLICIFLLNKLIFGCIIIMIIIFIIIYPQFFLKKKIQRIETQLKKKISDQYEIKQIETEMYNSEFKKNINEHNAIKQWKQIVTELYNNELKKYTTPYKLYSNWEGYRLGDMIIHQSHRLKVEQYHHQHFPNSIASDYMKQTTKQNDFDVLIKIIDTKNIIKPNKDDLIIHLRLGDVIDKHEVIDTLITNNNHAYIKSLQYYDTLLQNINKDIIKRIILVSGSHRDLNFKKSTLYINCIKKYCENYGFKVELRLGNHPDDDFVYMCNSTYYTPAGGGYSNLIKKIVQKKKGIIM